VRVFSPLLTGKKQADMIPVILSIIIIFSIGTKFLFAARGDSLSVIFNQGINTATWGVKANYLSPVGKPVRISFKEALLSSLLRTGNGMKWKDQHTFTILLTRPVCSFLSLNAGAESFLYRDRQSGFDSNIATHSAGVGFNFSKGNISIPFSAGIKNDSRYGHNDTGFSYKTDVNIPNFKIGDYINFFTAHREYDHLNKRRNSDISMSYNIHRTFYNETTDSLHLSYGQMRREYYLSALGDIESRQEKRVQAENRLNYKINDKLSYRIYSNFGSRILSIFQITDSTKTLSRKRNDFFSNMRGDFDISFKPVDIKLHIGYETMDQNYKLSGITGMSTAHLSVPDNKSSYTTMALSCASAFSADSMVLTGFIQKFKYDTPSSDNFDDRDELQIRCSFSEYHTFSGNIKAVVSASINFHHRVYIFGERSGDNNWTRILKFNPGIVWKPSAHLSWSHWIQVLANYISYDFEDMLPGVRSFLYRKFMSQDSLTINLTKKNSLRVTLQTEFDENGRFLYESWSEEKLFNRNRSILEIISVYKPCRYFRIASGYSYFFQNGKQYSRGAGSSSAMNLYYMQHGPSLEISYRGSRLFLTARGNTFITKTKSLNKKTLTRISLTMNWALN